MRTNHYRVSESDRDTENERNTERSLVCFDVNSKSTVPVVLGASRWVNAESKSVYEILQVMLTDQNAAGFPCYVSNVF